MFSYLCGYESSSRIKNLYLCSHESSSNSTSNKVLTFQEFKNGQTRSDAVKGNSCKKGKEREVENSNLVVISQARGQ